MLIFLQEILDKTNETIDWLLLLVLIHTSDNKKVCHYYFYYPLDDILTQTQKYMRTQFRLSFVHALDDEKIRSTQDAKN